MANPRFETLNRWLGRARAISASVVAVAAFLAFTAVPAVAQTGSITGTVVGGQTGSPLPDVAVSVAGTDISVATNAQGRFVILQAPTGQQTLTATLIGYGQESVTVDVPADGSVDAGQITLFTQAVELEGMVVTGTAIASQRREVGNSIALITSEDIEAAGVTSVDDILRGKALGLTVQGSGGQAGAGSQINIRGLQSLNGRNRPLIYLDGVRLNDRGAYESATESDQAATVLNSIDPQTIDRIEVIKGAAASTLYGTEASAGVIQIFTKQGVSGQRRWTFSVEQTLFDPTHVGPDEDPTGLHLNDCTRAGPIFDNQPTEEAFGFNDGCPESGSWLRTSHGQDYRLNVRGGGENFSYFASGRWGENEGITNVPDQFDEQAAEDLNLRANFTFNPFEDLQFRVNNSYVHREISWFQDGDNARGFVENVTKLDEGEASSRGLPDSVIFQSDIDQEIDQFTLGVNLNWTPLDNFQHRLNAGLDWSQSRTITFEPLGFWDFPDGSRTNDVEISQLITVDYAGSWNTRVADDWTSTLSWGGQLNDREDRGERIDCIEFIAPGERVQNECQSATFEGGGFGLQEDRTGFRSGGGFLQEQVGWNNRFFVTAGFRADAFSQVNQELDLEFLWQVFPKVQATYTLSDHDFFPSLFDTFRLRAAWGESGDPPPIDARQTLWQIAGADEIDNSGFIIQTLSNPDIDPERTSEYEVGVAASLWNGRVSLQGTGFLRETTDGILFNPLLPSDGVVENIPFNQGEWENKGIEAALDLNVVETRDLRVNVNGSYQWFDNEITSLGDVGTGSPQSLFTSFNQRFTEGESFPQFWGEPITNPNEEALPERDTVQNLGTSIPTQEVSLGLSVTFRNRLTVEAFGTGQLGHLVLDEGAEELATDGVWPQCIQPDGRTVDEQVLDFFFSGGTLENLPAQKIAQCATFSSISGVPIAGLNEDWLFDGDYFRIQSASVSYRVPENWLPTTLTGATVQFRATNLHVFGELPTGTDPDALLGAATFELFRSAGFTIPPPRSYTLNVRLNF